MSTPSREASVKLTLDGADFVVQLRKAGDEGEKAGQKGHHGMTLFGQGIHGAMHAVHGLHQSLETVTELATGLAAGFSMEEALKTTIELDSKFKHLAFRISKASGELVTAHELQEKVEESAAKAGRRTVEMADAFDQLEKSTGDAKFAQESLEGIGIAATATGEPVQALTHLAEELHEKFEVGGKEMNDVLAQVISASQRGGPQLDQFADVAGNMGAELAQAGMTGKRGLDFMIGSLTVMKSHFGSLPKAVKGVKATLLALGDKTKLADIGKHAGIDPSALLREKDLLGRLRMIMGKGKAGIAAIKGSMHESEEQKTLKLLFLDPFEKALETAGTAGKKGKAQIDEALDSLDHNIEHMGDSALTFAELEKEAAERMKDPQMQLQLALENMEKAFGQPEIISALNEMSRYLPKAAGALAHFVKFAVQHPLLAGAGIVAAKGGSGFASAFAGALAKKGGKKAWKSGSGLAKRGMSAARSTKLVKSIEDAHVAGIKMGNVLMGAAIIGAVVAAGIELGKLIKAAFDTNAQDTSDLSAAGAAAAGNGGSIEKQQADADRLKGAIDKAKDDTEGFGVSDFFAPIAHLVDKDAPNLRDQNEAQIKEMEEQLQKKQAHIDALKEAAKGDGKTTAEDHKAAGKALADALHGSKPLRVKLEGNNPLGSFASHGGGGGSRGPTRVPPAQHGGGY